MLLQLVKAKKKRRRERGGPLTSTRSSRESSSPLTGQVPFSCAAHQHNPQNRQQNSQPHHPISCSAHFPATVSTALPGCFPSCVAEDPEIPPRARTVFCSRNHQASMQASTCSAAPSGSDRNTGKFSEEAKRKKKNRPRRILRPSASRRGALTCGRRPARWASHRSWSRRARTL